MFILVLAALLPFVLALPDYDTIIVGGGLSGMTAAYKLHLAGKSVLVLEAADRYGGRTWSRGMTVNRKGDVQRFDFGGQWMGNTQPHVMQLVDRLNLTLYEQYVTGDTRIMLPDGQVVDGKDYDSGGISTGADFLQLAMCTDKSFTSAGGAAFCAALTAPIDVSPENVSYAYVLMYLNSAGNSLDNFFEYTGDAAQRFRVKNGAMTLCDEMAATLAAHTIRLNASVVSIDQRAPSEVIVTTANRHTITASRVVLAIPPVLAAAIEYQPALSDAKMQLMREFRPNSPDPSATKFVATYATPFWRTAGYSGNSESPFMLTEDASTPDGGFALLGFVDWTNGIVYSPNDSERYTSYTSHLAKMFGALAASPLQVLDVQWASRPWSRGAVATLAPGGIPIDYATLVRYPTGRLHWAGTETGTVWMGYMNGAVQAGERVTAEVLGQQWNDAQVTDDKSWWESVLEWADNL